MTGLDNNSQGGATQVPSGGRSSNSRGPTAKQYAEPPGLTSIFSGREYEGRELGGTEVVHDAVLSCLAPVSNGADPSVRAANGSRTPPKGGAPGHRISDNLNDISRAAEVSVTLMDPLRHALSRVSRAPTRMDTGKPGRPPATDKPVTQYLVGEPAKANIFSPKETYDHIVAAGVGKTTLTLPKQITLGVLAGFYISFSFMLTCTVGGQLGDLLVPPKNLPGLYNFIFGAVGFPLGLTIIMVVGADLFTSSCMYMITAFIEGRVSLIAVLKAWTISWFSNLCGCLFMTQLCLWAEIFEGDAKAIPVIKLAIKKTSHDFSVTMCKGIIANWLVNLAVWMANSARDVTGKAVGVYLPVSAFVTLGTEHCIANQYLLSMAYFLEPTLSAGAAAQYHAPSVHTIIVKNLIPATIGNIIGGAFFVGTFYSATYGSLYDQIGARLYLFYLWALPESWRKKYHDTKERMLERYDELLHPAPPPQAPEEIAAPEAHDTSVQPLARPSIMGDLARPSRMVSSGLRAVNKAYEVVSASPEMTAFEKKKTLLNAGTDVVV